MVRGQRQLCLSEVEGNSPLDELVFGLIGNSARDSFSSFETGLAPVTMAGKQRKPVLNWGILII